MKYICRCNCYVRNPQGRMQYFRTGDVVDFTASDGAPEHFEPADGAKNLDSSAQRENLRSRLRELKINCPANAGVETMRRKIREAETA